MSFFSSIFRSLKSIVLPLALGFGLAALGPAGGFLAKFGMSIGTMVGGLLFNRQKPPQASLGDINQPKSDYDVGIPISFGAMRFPAIYIDGDPKGCIREIKGKDKTRRTFTGAIVWCEGAENPKAIKKIWGNDDLIVDVDASTSKSRGFLLTTDALGVASGTHYKDTSQKLRNYPGNYKQPPDPKLVAIHGAGNVPAYRGCCYSMLEELDLEAWEYNLPNLRALVVDTLTGAQQIVSALAVRVGIPSAQLQLAPLAGKAMRSVVSTGPTEAKTLVEDVCNWHFVDLLDVNARLEACDRRNPKVWVISQSELGAHDAGQAAPPRVQVRVDQARTLPSIATLRFVDVGREWEVNSASTIQQNGRHEGENEASFEIAVAATYAEASNWIKPALDEAHAARFPVEVVLPFRRLAVGPGDVLQLPLEGDTIQARVTSQSAALPGPIGCQCVSYDAGVYIGHRLVNPPAPRPPATVRTYDAPSCVLIDCVALSDDDQDITQPLVYAAMTVSDTSTWAGGTLDFLGLKSPGGSGKKGKGGGFGTSGVMSFSDRATIGTAVTALPDGDAFDFDWSSTLTVDIEGGEALVGASEDEVLDGANRALLKSGAGWELLQWLSAEPADSSPPGKRRYVLSGLLRGRRGTERWMVGHAASDTFVLVDDALLRQPLSLSAIGTACPWTAANHFETTSGTITPQATNLKPLAPLHLEAVRDGAGNWIITWVRRDRRSDNWDSGQELPVSEGSIWFRLIFYSAGGQAIRAYQIIDGGSDFTLSAAAQVSDFGGPQGSLRLDVRQISNITPGAPGEGFATPITTFVP